MSMSPFAPVAFLYLLSLLIVFSTTAVLQGEMQANCSLACNNSESTAVKNVLISSTMDIKAPTMDALAPVTPPSQTDGGNTSSLAQTTAPPAPDTTHTTHTTTPLQKVQGNLAQTTAPPAPDTTPTTHTTTPLQKVQSSLTQTTAPPAPATTHTTHTTTPLQVQGSTTAATTTPEPVGTAGASSLASASTNSPPTTTTPPQQEHATESPADHGIISPKTSATTTNTPSTDGATTSASTPTPAKTPSSSLPSRRVTSPDQTSPSPTNHPGRTVAASASTHTHTPLAAGTKVAVVEVAGAPLTSQLVDTASLLAIVLFGLVFFVATVAVFVSQAYESYKRKDYTQVDYLINGMYDTGV